MSKNKRYTEHNVMEFEQISYDRELEITHGRYLSLYSKDRDMVDTLKLHYNIKNLVIINMKKKFLLKKAYSAISVKHEDVYEHTVIFDKIEEISDVKYKKIINNL